MKSVTRCYNENKTSVLNHEPHELYQESHGSDPKIYCTRIFLIKNILMFQTVYFKISISFQLLSASGDIAGITEH